MRSIPHVEFCRPVMRGPCYVIGLRIRGVALSVRNCQDCEVGQARLIGGCRVLCVREPDEACGRCQIERTSLLLPGWWCHQLMVWALTVASLPTRHRSSHCAELGWWDRGPGGCEKLEVMRGKE